MKSRSLSTKPAAADRAKLTRQTIVQAALELLNEEGLDRLSTRRLAARLGVQSATLYWHVKNKQELLDMMAAAILFRPPPNFVMQGSWWVWMGDLARQIRRNLLEYRDGARVVAGTRPTDALGPTGIEELFARMHTQGLDRTQAWHVLASLSRFALGWAIDEQAARSSEHVTGSAINFDVEFEFGLQALIDGLRRARRPRRTPKGFAN